MPYIDGLPTTTTLAPTDLLVACQGSTGAPGTGADRSVPVSVFQAAISGVSTFNTRAGAVTLQAADVNTALGYSVSTAMQPVVSAATKVLGAQTLLSTGSVLALTGGPVTTTFAGSGTSANMWQSTVVNAASPTVPEVTAQYWINSNTGLANHQTAYKIALSVSAQAGSASADIYGINSIVQGHGGTQLVTGFESDVNNIGADATTLGGDTAVYGIVSVCAGSAKSTAGVWVTYGGAGWTYGVAVSNASNAAFWEGTIAGIGLALHGSHTTGIDMLSGFPISIAMALPNNCPIRGNDTGGTGRNLITIDTSNNVLIGDPSAIGGAVVTERSLVVSGSNALIVGGHVGFNGAAASGKITITGSRGGATAAVLGQLLQAMQAFGLVTDSTTA